MFWRSNTEPPKLSLWLLSAVASKNSRRFLLDDLQDEFEQRVIAEGRAAACRFYRRQVRDSVAPLISARLGRLRRRANLDQDGVSFGWRPWVSVQYQPRLHGAPMSDLASDIRLAVRTCFANPLPTLMIIVSLGLGIGSTTAIYSFSRALLFGAEPLADVVRVYFSAASDPSKAYGDVSAPDYRDLRSDIGTFETTAMFRLGGVELRSDEARRRLLVELVADDYFAITRLSPTLGRLPTVDELPLKGALPVAVLGYDLWRSHFGADPQVLGRSVRLDGKLFTVVGVGPEGYSSRLMGLRVDAWLPLGVDGGISNVAAGELEDRGDTEYGVLARLRPGASPAQARSQLELLADRLGRDYPEQWVDVAGGVRRFSLLVDDGSRVPPEARGPISLLLGLVALACAMVLLIACSNAAGLALARGQRRRREMAVRLSVGASHGRLVRMLLIESALPALAAAGVGLVVSRVLTNLLQRPTLPIDFPLGWQVAQDGRVLLFALAVGVVSTLLFGLAPALESARTDLVDSLKGDAVGGSGRGLRLRRFLIVGQVGLAVVFVIVAAVMTSSAERLDTTDLGFDVDRVAIMSRGLTRGELAGEGRSAALETLRERLLARPEVDSVGFSSSAESTFLAEGLELKVGLGDREPELVGFNAVSEHYLETMGIPLLRGVGLEQTERNDVAVVNQSFVHHFAAELGSDTGTVLGSQFRLIDPDGGASDVRRIEVVGVAANGAYRGPGLRDQPFFWIPFDANAENWAIVTVRGNEGAALALQALRDESQLSEGELALIAPRTYSSLVEAQTASVKTASRWIAGIGLLGLMLALMGIYGLISYIVGLRSRELAIRQALGASPRRLVLGVAGGGLKLAAWGFALGLVPALVLAWSLTDLVPGSRAVDAGAVVFSGLLIGVATLWASAWPARSIAGRNPARRLMDR